MCCFRDGEDGFRNGEDGFRRPTRLMKRLASPRYLLDVNVLVALINQDHVHHELVREWFYASPSLAWAICAFTEAGFLRNATAPRAGQIAMSEATAILHGLALASGLPLPANYG